MAYRYYDFKNIKNKYTKSESFMNHNHQDILIRNKPSNVDNMVKNSRRSKNGKKYSNNTSILSTGDQELISSASKQNTKKTPVYVHDFKANYVKNDNNNQMKTHSNVSHGFQDYVNGKSKILKSKFDSLTLMRGISPNINYNKIVEYNEPSQYMNREQSHSNTRHLKQDNYFIKKQKPKIKKEFDESVINKLEESYWANWKPNKKASVKNNIKKHLDKVYSERLQHNYSNYRHHKQQNVVPSVRKKPSLTKKASQPRTPTVSSKTSDSSMIKDKESNKTDIDCYMNETEVINFDMSSVKFDDKNPFSKESDSQVNVDEKPLKFLHTPTETARNIDSNCSENEFNLILEDHKKKTSNESVSSKLKLMDLQKDSTEIFTISLGNKDTVGTYPGPGSSQNRSGIIKKDIRNLEDKLSKSLQPHLAASSSCNSEQDNIHTIKHTDSFIITTKKQNLEKPHYPQPKCIKLQKNTPLVNRSHNYVKGGSYPLKSCLKKEKMSSQSLVLGKPGSPMLVQPNKNKKIRKCK